MEQWRSDWRSNEVHYVLHLELPEGLFWDGDAGFLAAVAESKGAFGEWLAGEQDGVRSQGVRR